ncbi:MAG: ABC transporter permease [Candidatus Acidiferrales bacterium]
MFWRLVVQLLRGSRGRLVVAILAIVSGAAVISALLNLDLGVQSKLTQEFRTLGANIVIAPANGAPAQLRGAEAPRLMREDEVVGALQRLRAEQVGAAAPYLYIVARAKDVAVVVAGTWLDQAQKLDPTWKLEGNWVEARADDTHCLVGRNVARQMHLGRGDSLQLDYMGRSAECSVAGVVDAGGPEDNQVFASLRSVQTLANLPGQIGLAQVSVTAAPKTIAAYAAELARALPQYEVRPIRQVADAEGALLGRIRLLIVSMVLLILILTALCVLGTMAALAMERRKDVGLMKSLGGSIARIVGIFLAEVGVLGAAGGLLGAILGVALSYWMGLRVFGTAISPRWEVFPVTVALMIVVALAGALPLRLLGNVKPAEILRGE